MDFTSPALIRMGEAGTASSHTCTWSLCHLGAPRAAGQMRGRRSDSGPGPLLTDDDDGSSFPLPCPLEPHLSDPWPLSHSQTSIICSLPAPLPPLPLSSLVPSALCSQPSNMDLCLLWARPLLGARDMEMTNEGPQGGHITVWERDHRPLKQH